MSANHSEQLLVRLEKRFRGGASALASYTWSRVRDVQTPLRVNTRGAVNWSSRAVSGRHEDLRTRISSNDIPHRVVLAGTWRAPWQLDVFNLLNLLDSDWGLRRDASALLLEHVGQTPRPGGTSLPVFRFDVAAPKWIVNPVESAFQLRLGLRYRF